jgi:V8-like Glu-specific endopeptidase
MLRSTLIWLGVAGAVVTGVTSWSVSATIFDRQGQRLTDPRRNYRSIDWQMLNSTAAYSGIGLIKIRQSATCTGFLVSTQASAPAYVITNAHCTDLLSNLPGANDIILNKTLRSIGRAGAPLTFTPNYFAQVPTARRSYEVQRVLYATMKNNDFALLELSPTQKELIIAGFSPLRLSPTPSPTGAKIEVIGIPGETVPFDRQFMHWASCVLGPMVKVQEGAYTWSQSLKHHCSIVGGMSGAPMIAQGQVVGIVNTGGADGLPTDRPTGQKCVLDRPCELGKNKKTVVTSTANYGQLLTKITTCFSRQGVFDVSQPSCRLEKPDRS